MSVFQTHNQLVDLMFNHTCVTPGESTITWLKKNTCYSKCFQFDFFTPQCWKVQSWIQWLMFQRWMFSEWIVIETNHWYVDLQCTSMDTGIYDFGPWQNFDGSIPHMAFKFRAADASDWCISPEKRTLGSSLNIDDPRVICIGTGQGSIDWWWRSDSFSNWWVHLPGATWVCQQVTKGVDNCLHSREDLEAHQVLEATVSSNGRY